MSKDNTQDFTPDSLFKDYARAPVPAASTKSGWAIGLISIGVALTLPAFLTGAKVGLGVGFAASFITAIAAGLERTAFNCGHMLVFTPSLPANAGNPFRYKVHA